jgi:hypothetical protein
LSFPDLPVRSLLKHRPTLAQMGSLCLVWECYVPDAELSDKSIRVLDHLVVFPHECGNHLWLAFGPLPEAKPGVKSRRAFKLRAVRS